MKTIGHHFAAIQWTVGQLTKGKFMLYFIPGLLIALGFGWLENWSSGLISTESNADATWYSSWFSKGINQTGHFLTFIFHQLAIFFVLTLLSPINTFLSESVETELTGARVGFDVLRFVNDIIRMVFVVFIAISLELILMGIWSMIAWIFSLEILTPAVFFISASYFYGFSFYDYSLERHEISVLGSMRFAKRYALPTLVTGIFFSLILYIPIVGLALSPVLITIISTHVFLKTVGKLDKNTTP